MTESETSRPNWECESEYQSLFSAAQQGDSRSFARLYLLTRSRLMRIILRINGDRHDAEEILQETFLRAWVRAAQFDARRGMIAQWLGGIAHHAATDSLRRRGARPQRQLTYFEDEEADCYSNLLSPMEGPLEQAVRNGVKRALHQRLQRLPSLQRQILLLAFYDGLSYAEIATKLEHPLGTVKSWARRSMAEMCRDFDEH